jgi:hypothetical protein
VPPQPLDALENLPKERPGQVAFGKLEGEVPRVPDQSSAGLEQALLEARERPILDGDRQDEPAEEVAEVVGDDAEEQPDLVGPEAVTRQPGPVGGRLALLDPPLGGAPLVIEADEARFVPVKVVTMKPTRGNSSPR